MHSRILVGTASWSDPGFVADWYPRKVPAAERLSWYAEHFNLVELNSSFYGIPKRNMVERWCKQTPRDFVFDVKLFRLLSRHSTKLKFLSPDLRPKASLEGDKILLTPRLEKLVAKRFLHEIEPLAEDGKMGALLLQLSPSFGPRHHQLTELDSLLELLTGHQVAVELRNAGWLKEDQLAKTEAFFRKRQLCFVLVDGPKAEHFMILPDTDLITDRHLAYMRLHGRNAKGYISGRSVAERFNYLYSKKELKEVADRVEHIAENVTEMHVIYNNNTSSYAPQNAYQFREILQDRDLDELPRRTDPWSEPKAHQARLQDLPLVHS